MLSRSLNTSLRRCGVDLIAVPMFQVILTLLFGVPWSMGACLCSRTQNLKRG